MSLAHGGNDGIHTVFGTNHFQPPFAYLLAAPPLTDGGMGGVRAEERAGSRDSETALAVFADLPRAGYVELPYTLPQDFTLFLLLREQTVNIWLQKVDWIARHGGMALVNVHPDYLCFDGAAPKRMEYPSTYYRALLEYVNQRYAGVFWNTIPGKVAQFFADATNVPGARAPQQVLR